MAFLLDLPVELVSNIFKFLSDEDVFTARQAARYVYASSLGYFGHRFFRKRGYLITTPSINVLKCIAAHEEFRKHVKHVWFNPDLYTMRSHVCSPGPDFDWGTPHGDGDEYESVVTGMLEKHQSRFDAYLECTTDHQSLLRSELLQRELTTAFATLPNLKVIGMRRSEGHKPWGWRGLAQAIGADPRILGSIPPGPKKELSAGTELFLAIINAAAATNVRLERLYTDVVEVDNVLPDLLPEVRLNQVLESVLYLEINASQGYLEECSDSTCRYRVVDADAKCGHGLLKVMRAATNLREIGLQIFPDLKQSHLVPPMYQDPNSWRRSYPYVAFKSMVCKTSFASLTRVKLEKLTTKPRILQAFLETSQKSLTSVKLRDLRLLCSKSKSGERCWEPIFSFLHTSCPNLDYILFYHLMYDRGGVSFEENPPPAAAYTNRFSATQHDVESPGDAGQTLQSEPAGGEFFTRYDHIAAMAVGRQAALQKLSQIVEGHWYQKPVFSYDMDEGLWHTDTSDEEW